MQGVVIRGSTHGPKKAIEIILTAYIPTIVSILIMIMVRAQDLANETLNAGLEPGFFNPTTTSEAVYSGFIIWIPGALFVGILAFALYMVMRRFLKVPAVLFLATTLILATLLTAGLFINKVPFAPERAYEMFACALGYGILIPYLSTRWA